MEQCSICSSPNSETHLSINACRACAIFYRRAESKGISYACRRGDQYCTLDRSSGGQICKRCRYNKMRAIRSSRMTNHQMLQTPCVSCPSTSARNDEKEELSSLRTGAPVLNRIRYAYNQLCSKRMEKELNGVAYDEGKFQATPMTFLDMPKTAGILYECLAEFAEMAFPEFLELSPEDQKSLLSNFYKSFREFEAGFRSLKRFKSCDNLFFFGMTKYVDLNNLDLLVAGLPHSEVMKSAYRTKDNESYMHVMHDWIHAMEKAKFSAEEFVAGVGFLFWNIDGKAVSDELSSIAAAQRGILLSELHHFYRNVLCMDDYSFRIGEMFMIISTIERRLRSKFHLFDMLKLLDIFDDDVLHLAKMQLD